MRDASIKAATRAAQAGGAQNFSLAAARAVAATARSATDAPTQVALAPTPEQLHVAQCQTLQGYEAELAAQIFAGAAGTDSPSLSGLREQLAITRARRLELGC